MATIISDTLDMIDSAISDYAEIVFDGIAGPLTTTLQLGGVLSLALLAFNGTMQFVPMRISQYLIWSVRFVVVLSVATTWSQFQPIYEILTIVPSSIGAEMLTVTSAPTLNAALDDMVTEIFDFADRADEESSMFSISLTSVILTVLGTIMAGVAIIVSVIAKVGFAFAVALAPVFIATLLFSATSDLFRTWVKFTIGFALIPLVLAGVMGAVLYVGQEIVAMTGPATTLGDAANLIVICFVASVLMFQVPTMVNGLAGSIVATYSGMQEARMACDAADRAVRQTGRAVGRAVLAERSASATASASESDGGSRIAARMAEWRMASEKRRQTMTAFARRQAALGNETTWSERREAGRAGMDQWRRDNIASGGKLGRDAIEPPEDDPDGSPRRA